MHLNINSNEVYKTILIQTNAKQTFSTMYCTKYW